MSFTCTVLPLLSVFHNSRPVTPSSAEKSNALFKTAKALGVELAPGLGLMSFTRTVPLSVPSVFHSSTPAAAPLAEKYNALLKTVSPETRETALTRTVLPAASVFHSSAPVVPSSAEKYKALLNTVRSDGEESPTMLMSVTRTVPLGVPSVFHSSRPATPSSAAKYKAPLNTVKPLGEELPLGRSEVMSFTGTASPAGSAVFDSSAALPSSPEGLQD